MEFRREDAEFLRENPLLRAILAKLEADNLNLAVMNANSPDKARESLLFVKAIRALDAELRRMSAAPPPKKAPVA